MSHKKQVVYFLEVDGRSIKIGKTRKLENRLQSHRRKYQLVKFLGAVYGGDMEERYIQRYFRHSRESASGDVERFKPTKDLCDYIRWLRDQFFCLSCEGAYPDELYPDIGFDLWSPVDEARRKERRIEVSLFEQHDPYPELTWPKRALVADDYYTPPVILGPARNALGEFDLDPASCAMANRNVKAKSFFTNSQDGLAKDWYGRVWCNPPFSVYDDFVNKAFREAKAGKVSQMIFLASSVKLTALYFQPLLLISNAICIMEGRHNHEGLGKDKQSTTGHVLIYHGLFPEKFKLAVECLGTVWIKPLPVL